MTDDQARNENAHEAVPDEARRPDWSVSLVNVVEGTGNVILRYIEDFRWLPAPGSPAALELVNDETGPGGEWGPRPVDTALSLAAMTFFASVDHLGSIRCVIGERMTFLGCHVMSRSTIEAAARSWWLSEPGLNVRERVGRSTRERLRSVDDNIRTLRDLGAAEALLSEQRAYRERVLNQAIDLGLPVQFEDGQPKGIQVSRPNSTDLVADLLTESGYNAGRGVYSFLSGIDHASASALFQFFDYVEDETPPSPRLHSSRTRPRARPEQSSWT